MSDEQGRRPIQGQSSRVTIRKEGQTGIACILQKEFFFSSSSFFLSIRNQWALPPSSVTEGLVLGDYEIRITAFSDGVFVWSVFSCPLYLSLFLSPSQGMSMGKWGFASCKVGIPFFFIYK